MAWRIARGRAIAGWMLAVALGAPAVGCGGSDAGPAATATAARAAAGPAAARTRLLATGQRVFERQCSFCHRLNGRRAPRIPRPDAYGSSFDEIQTTEAFVAERVTKGFGGMQSFSSELSPHKIRAVALYVVANQGRDVEAPKPPPPRLAAGQQVFVAHCQTCHSIAARPQTQEPEWQATDFRVVKPSVPFVESVLDGTGNAFMIELMPEVQGKLSRREIRDVAAYVNAIAASGGASGG